MARRTAVIGLESNSPTAPLAVVYVGTDRDKARRAEADSIYPFNLRVDHLSGPIKFNPNAAANRARLAAAQPADAEKSSDAAPQQSEKKPAKKGDK